MASQEDLSASALLVSAWSHPGACGSRGGRATTALRMRGTLVTKRARLDGAGEAVQGQVVRIVAEGVLDLDGQLLDAEHEEGGDRHHRDHDPAERVDQRERQHEHPADADDPEQPHVARRAWPG